MFILSLYVYEPPQRVPPIPQSTGKSVAELRKGRLTCLTKAIQSSGRTQDGSSDLVRGKYSQRVLIVLPTTCTLTLCLRQVVSVCLNTTSPYEGVAELRNGRQVWLLLTAVLCTCILTCVYKVCNKWHKACKEYEALSW